MPEKMNATETLILHIPNMWDKNGNALPMQKKWGTQIVDIM